MEGFTYYNIFETKGIEYIAIIIFFMMLIPFWLIISRRVQIVKKIQEILGTLSFSSLRIPKGLYFSKNHSWTFLEKTGLAKIGVDDLVLKVTGDIKVINLKSPGDQVRQDEKIAELDHRGKRLAIFSPISGKVENINELIMQNPGIISEDPYNAGWMFTILPSDWKTETQKFYLADEAITWAKNELARFREFVAGAMNKYALGSADHVLQDGGELYDHTLSDLPEELWKDFQQEFLNPGT